MPLLGSGLHNRRVTNLVLTPNRRDELAALLADDERLHAAYPKVAEYLDLDLKGSGDDEADRLFDIRFVHYMTNDEAGNPYWDIIEPAVCGNPIGTVTGKKVNGGRPTGSARLAFAQTILQEAYAFAIPAPATLRWFAAVSGDLGVLELGAGRGYWAHQLERSGLDVLAFDSEPPDTTTNTTFPISNGQRTAWHKVGNLDDLKAARASGADLNRLLFLCWPPGWGNPMAVDALERFEEAGGRRLIYVGEPRGGKTATDAFFDRLSDGWNLVDEDSGFVSWWNLNDVAQCWSR